MIQFVPKIPAHIQKALMQDNLVLFCGAGISRQNGLPSFQGLIKKLCEKFNMDINNKETLKKAYKKGNYPEFLGLLEKDPKLKEQKKTLREYVIEILSDFTGEPKIHKDLLELSALPDKRGYRLVTTNFDRLFFEAGLNPKWMDSAPKLVQPRKGKWTYLTFLHGVIDKKNDPKGKNLVLTNPDFGLAYLSDDPWAKCFMRQLCQNWTVLFVGYSFNDTVMKCLMSAITDKNKIKWSKPLDSIPTGEELRYSMPPNSIYAFAGYKEGKQKEKKEEWRDLGIEPIPYRIKENKRIDNEEDHSLLYETIKEWANLKKDLAKQKRSLNKKIKTSEKTLKKHETIQKLSDLKKLSFSEQKSFLKEKLRTPFKEDTDGERAETVISLLKTNKRLAEHFPKINLLTETPAKAEKKDKSETKKSSPDGDTKPRPVDISWLKAFDEKQEKSESNENNPFSFDEKPKNSLLIKLTRPSNNLWEPLSHFERNMALWLCRHLDKKELIHALIETGALLNNLITLHPEFKGMIESKLENENLDKRKNLFWQILTTQKDSPRNICWGRWAIIDKLNEKYSLPQAKKLLESLEPKIGFEKSFYHKALDKISRIDRIYEPKLTIQESSLDNRNLTNETALLSYSEDFTNLLKRAMELAEYAGIIHKKNNTLLYMQRPSIAEHVQNTSFYPWTLLIVLARDSFDKAMQKKQKLALSLLERWKLYPYSIFYRLILYAVTKYKTLDETIALELLVNNKANVLWSISCQNEVLRYLERQGRHSPQTMRELVSLIMKGPPRSLYKKDLNEKEFIKLKEISIYKRLNCLEMAGAPQK